MASLRTKKAFARAPPASAAQATGSAPIVIPPTAVAPHSRELRGEQRAERGEALGAQDRALGVHVVLSLRAAGQRHPADHERVLAQLVDQSLARRPQLVRMCVQHAHRRP